MIDLDEEYWCWVNLRQAIHPFARANGDSTTADGDDEDGLVTADLTTVDNRISQLKAEDFERLWENGTGLCTSFTVFVALQLNRTHGHESTLSDNGYHRVAYCSVDSRHIIIDSSARWLMTTNRENAVRGFKGVKCGLESKIGSSKAYVPFTDLASFADGMRICLRQMAKDGTHITLFRLSPQDDTSSPTKKHCVSDQEEGKKPEGEGKKPEEEDEHKWAICKLYAIPENDDKA
ncbi:hypothetical protein FQN51_001091 [Onygenales sp. PD_10]|nr:hypothetical protein FQN51_001091 [Onygenales sp. PD_10]